MKYTTGNGRGMAPRKMLGGWDAEKGNQDCGVLWKTNGVVMSF